MNNCEFCDKKGLAVLPVRPAIAPAGGHAPKGNAAMLSCADSIPVAPADYTLRHLRPGYLYTYDEARKWLHAYVVTEGGYLYKLDPGETAPAKLAFTCAPDKCGTVASCVTIPDVKRATKVWFGFSDVQWTPAVIERHKDAAYRAKHMVCLDVQAWLGSKHHKGAADISQVEKVVAEYALSDAQGKSLAFTAGGFKSKASTSQALKDRIPAISPAGGLVLSMPDPAGVATDIALLMKQATDRFVSHPTRKREVAVSSMIDGMEEAIRTQAQRDELDAAESLANQQMANAGVGLVFSSVRQSIERTRDVTAGELQRASDNGWGKYTCKFDGKTRDAWRKTFERELKVHDEIDVAPLARAHASWMKSVIMAHYFECNYDGQSAESGAVYAGVMGLCIAATQDKAACSKLYEEWLTQDASKRQNLLLRAMLFNLDEVAKKVDDAAKVSIDPRQIPWDNIFAIYANATQRLSAAASDAVAQLVTQALGPLARVLDKAADGWAGGRAAVMALGLVAQHPVVICSVEGSRKTMRAAVIKQLLASGGQIKNQHQMQRAVSAELRRLKILGTKVDGSVKRKWVVLADAEAIKRMPPGLEPQQRAEWLAKSIRTMDDVEALNLGRWRQVISQNVRFGVVAGLFQFYSLTKALEDDAQAMANDKTDSSRRSYAAIAALGVTTADVIGHVVQARALQGMRLGSGLASFSGSVLKIVGRLGGAAVGLVVAGLDVLKGKESAQEGQTGLMWLYYSTAFVGTSLSLVLLAATFPAVSAILGAALVPLVAILVALLIGISLWIEFVKDNAIQNWLERSIWGILPQQRYPDYETEQKELRLALKA
ncbi:MAG: hypothetical protein HY836_12755 [Aquabacterium sp.]|uniref:T6SS effector BTH_I2691 family protein n=1 Tax=Aquabacterium sp. TaxID=1872578 RepID=UPI0025BCAD34|nr:T6SS effector BTH_I2691 family protein [Aquabacterium sp.]MBI5926452.1 hypothetical protein [Aquabacterium sp.]